MYLTLVFEDGSQVKVKFGNVHDFSLKALFYILYWLSNESCFGSIPSEIIELFEFENLE